ncbi:tyrosine-protein phosphatase [Erysipelothrix sp. D19-032]
MQKRYRFKQVHNFRDLGGYPLANGSQTKWNALFRSDDMGLLRPEEVMYLEQRGLQTVIDLRHQEELARVRILLRFMKQLHITITVSPI